jgi:5-methylthioadenosine/S-adenosylhomocysteine deaminase
VFESRRLATGRIISVEHRFAPADFAVFVTIHSGGFFADLLHDGTSQPDAFFEFRQIHFIVEKSAGQRAESTERIPRKQNAFGEIIRRHRFGPVNHRDQMELKRMPPEGQRLLILNDLNVIFDAVKTIQKKGGFLVADDLKKQTVRTWIFYGLCLFLRLLSVSGIVRIMSILIQQVEWNGSPADVFIRGNLIEKIGDCSGQTADLVLDGKNKVILPTFHNAHTHAAMAYMRSYADDIELHTWLTNHIWPLESGITEEDVYHGARLACLEMIKSGTTFFNDMYWFWNGTARAVDEMGLRAALSAVFIDFDDPVKAKEQIGQNQRLFVERRRYSDRIMFQLGPHAIYTVSKTSLRWCAEFAAEHDLMIHIHLSETQKEVTDCIARHGLRPAGYLDSIGFLGPNVTAAHCIWLEQAEMELLAARGVKALHCPVSNMKLASGKFRFTDAVKAGMQVAIGTDGAASNNCLDMGSEIKTAALLEKHFTGDTTALNAPAAWHAGTRACAEFFGLNSGIIAEGALADCMLVDLNNERLAPGHHLIADMVYSADSSCIDTVLCDGKILMQNRRVPGEEEIIAQGREFKEKFRR